MLQIQNHTTKNKDTNRKKKTVKNLNFLSDKQ
jgi:hypothetical protein